MISVSKYAHHRSNFFIVSIYAIHSVNSHLCYSNNVNVKIIISDRCVGRRILLSW